MAALIGRRLRGGDDRGAELIELAVALPILLMVLAGIIDFGLLFQRYEVLTNAAREGARVAVLPGYSAADVQARVQNYLDVSGLSGTATTAVVGSSETLPGGQVVSTAAVTVDYSSSFVFLGPMAALVGGSSYTAVPLQARSVMRAEGITGF